MTHRTPLRRLVLGLALITAGLSAGAHADNEQYFPLQSYRVGPYAAGGTGFFGGFIDYLQYINSKGGVNGVKLTWSECETEYVVEKGVECYERLKGGLNGAPAAATSQTIGSRQAGRRTSFGAVVIARARRSCCPPSHGLRHRLR